MGIYPWFLGGEAKIYKWRDTTDILLPFSDFHLYELFSSYRNRDQRTCFDFYLFLGCVMNKRIESKNIPVIVNNSVILHSPSLLFPHVSLSLFCSTDSLTSWIQYECWGCAISQRSHRRTESDPLGHVDLAFLCALSVVIDSNYSASCIVFELCLYVYASSFFVFFSVV